MKNKINVINQCSFICSLIFVFYTFLNNSDEYGGLWVLILVMIGPFICAPQIILCILDLLKKDFKVFRIIVTILGIVLTIVALKMVNYQINIFAVINILLLILSATFSTNSKQAI